MGKPFVDAELLASKWRLQLPDYFEPSACSSKKARTSFGPDFKLFYSERRASKYYKRKAEQCIFDGLCRKSIKFPRHKAVANLFPFAPRHRVIYSRKHYQEMRFKDLEFALELAPNAAESFIYATKGSGAGIPEHFHFQSFNAELPAFKASSRLFYNDGFRIEKPEFPSYCLKFSGTGFARILYSLIQESNHSFNLAVSKDSLLYFPRSKEVPENWWKFGAAELSGFFVFRDFQKFKAAKANELYKPMKDACLGLKEQERTESLLESLLPEKSGLAKN
ncbi:MAG TPA: hypothetical protein HA227_05245 [Candidatus Diapherotrites archaeon]|uniref:DUF4922 domain-containing protein n=1 Tax=Candidatus Iainarchaeum sp. TaxID=3101447 RepID=A0A7J4KUD5_9ARCH|nr:hypothetical protein [Candidatus Diapherotrites archaeon]